MKKILIMMVLAMMTVGNMAMAGAECETSDVARNSNKKNVIEGKLEPVVPGEKSESTEG